MPVLFAVIPQGLLNRAALPVPSALPGLIASPPNVVTTPAGVTWRIVPLVNPAGLLRAPATRVNARGGAGCGAQAAVTSRIQAPASSRNPTLRRYAVCVAICCRYWRHHGNRFWRRSRRRRPPERKLKANIGDNIVKLGRDRQIHLRWILVL